MHFYQLLTEEEIQNDIKIKIKSYILDILHRNPNVTSIPTRLLLSSLNIEYISLDDLQEFLLNDFKGKISDVSDDKISLSSGVPKNNSTSTVEQDEYKINSMATKSAMDSLRK